MRVTRTPHRKEESTMKLYKKSERKLKTADLLKTFRACGHETRHIGEFDRWKDLSDGGRLQVKIQKE